MAEDSERTARLVVRRNADFDVKIRNVYVSVDGGSEKALQFGGSAQLMVSPGKHEVKATNRLFTKRAPFEVAEGESVVFVVANTPGGCLLVLAAVGAVPCRLRLERMEGDH